MIWPSSQNWYTTLPNGCSCMLLGFIQFRILSRACVFISKKLKILYKNKQDQQINHWLDGNSCYASGPKHVQALQIQEVHPVAHSTACNFYLFSYLFYLGHLSLLGLQRPEDKATLLLSARSSSITRRHPWAPGKCFCACYLLALTKVPRAKVGHLGSPGWIPMIQAPFNSSCVAL